MKYQKHSPFTLLFVALLAVGCGDESTPNNSGPIRTCGAGTVLNPLFECVPDGRVICSPGTVEVDGKCVADASVCGDDTRWEDGKCVPDGIENTCGDGTTFVEGTGRCTPDVVCGAGTTAVGGKCLSDGEVLVAEVDAREDAAENDPDFGGVPQAIVMPVAGDSFLLEGTISQPTDKNQDGTLNQDVDVYSFEAQGSDFVRVHLRQVGVGSFGFEVHGPNGYYREGPRNAAGPSRSLLLPAGGTYEIRIQPQATMFEPGSGAVGGEDHRYLLVLENVGGLDFEKAEIIETATSQKFSASFQNPEKQLARILHPAGSVIGLRVDPDSGVGITNPVLMVLDAQGKVVSASTPGQGQHLMRSGEENSRFLYVDYVQADSLEMPVVVEATNLDAISFPNAFRADEMGNVQVAAQLLPGVERYFSFEIDARTASGAAVPQGMVVNFSLNRTAGRPAELRVYSPDSQVITTSLENRVWFYAEKPGVYLVELKNLDVLNSLNFSNLNVATYLPLDLGQLDAGTKNKQTSSFAVPANGVQFFTYKAGEPLVSKMKATPALGQSVDAMEISGVDMLPLASAYEGVLEINRHVVLSPERRVGSLFNDGGQRASGLLEITASALPAGEVEPNNTRLQANELVVEADKAPAPVHGSVRGTDVDYFKFVLGKNALVGFETRVISGSSALKVQLLNDKGTLIELGNRRNEGITLGAVLQADTVYYLSVGTDTPEERTEYAVFSSLVLSSGSLEVEPNGLAAQATVLGADAVEMVGTLGGYTDVDWYELSLGQARWVKPEWRSHASFEVTHDSAKLTFYAADGTTMLDFETMVKLPAGKSYVRVSTAESVEKGNTYHLGLKTVDFESLGALVQGESIGRQSVGFSEAGELVGYSFELEDDLPLDSTQAVFAWTSAQLTVFDSRGTAVFVARDSGQVFGSAAEPSMYVRALEAGTYYVTVQREYSSRFDLLIGQITHRGELEIPGTSTNSTYDFAEVLGTLVADEAMYVHGVVSMEDRADYFEFVVPGQVGDGARDVSLELFRMGEAVADIGLALFDLDGNPLVDANQMPQVMSVALEPGRYLVRARLFDDVGFNSGDYLLRILMTP